jgi:hypothetical protein
MWLSASKVMVLSGLSLAALLLGAVLPTRAQESPDLRLSTDTSEMEDGEVVTEVSVAPAPITIGDDVPQPVPRPLEENVGPYDPLGLRMGGFLVFPTLETTAGVSIEDSDATAAETRLVTRLRPGIKAESNWSRHQLTINGGAELGYTTGSDEAVSLLGNLEADLRLDVRRGTTADLRMRYEAVEDDATSGGSGVEHTFDASLALTHDHGPIKTKLKGGVIRRVFDDTELSGGGTQDNADRAYTELSLALRSSLTREAVLTPFAEVAYEPRLYDKKKDRNGFARSSQGLRLSAGLEILDGPVWTGEVAANLLYRSYDDSSLEDAFVPGLSAAIVWSPTDLTRFEFNASASLDETIAAGESTTARWSSGFTVAHDLRENLTISAGTSLTKETGASDSLTLGTELGLSWALNRNVVFGLRYSGEYENADTDTQEHSLIGSIILRR